MISARTVCNVKDFGAVGDGIAKDTAAIQTAIDNGEVTYFPPGVYLSGTLYLRSNGGLELAPEAALLASPDREDYNGPDFCIQNRLSEVENTNGAHLIVAIEQENIVIQGGGKIDGNAGIWHGALDAKRNNNVYLRPKSRPSQMIFFCECKNIRIQDVELRNSPYWTCFLHGCDNAYLEGLQIVNDPKMREVDGIDIDCCNNVTISDCLIETADDGITLRGNSQPLKKKRPCENVVIKNCVISSGYANGVRIGVGDGVIRNSQISNVKIKNKTRTGFCIIAKYSDKNEGVDISGINIRDIQLDVLRPLDICLDGTQADKNPCGKKIDHICLTSISGNAELSSNIIGNSVGRVENIKLTNIDLFYHAMGSNKDRLWKGCCESSPAAFHLENTANISFNHVNIHWPRPDNSWLYEIESINAKNIKHQNCNFTKGIIENENILGLTYKVH